MPGPGWAGCGCRSRNRCRDLPASPRPPRTRLSAPPPGVARPRASDGATERAVGRFRRSLEGRQRLFRDPDPAFHWVRRGPALLTAGVRRSYALGGPREQPGGRELLRPVQGGGQGARSGRRLAFEELAAVVRDPTAVGCVVTPPPSETSRPGRSSRTCTERADQVQPTPEVRPTFRGHFRPPATGIRDGGGPHDEKKRTRRSSSRLLPSHRRHRQLRPSERGGMGGLPALRTREHGASTPRHKHVPRHQGSGRTRHDPLRGDPRSHEEMAPSRSKALDEYGTLKEGKAADIRRP